MKQLLLALLLCVTAHAELTVEQFWAQREFANHKEWTFQYDVGHIGKHHTGYVPAQTHQEPVSLGRDAKLKSMDLADFNRPLTRVLDQGNCGSCVIFSVIANFQDAMKLRELPFPELSPQHLMSCGTGGQCNGADGEEVSADLVTLKNLYSESDYPYTQRSGKCRTKTADRYGQIASYTTIDGSVRSILAAIHNGQPVSVGIAADNAWSSYSSGRYNACGSMGINHYVVVQGVDCETSVDADGYCVFDAKGNLPAGVGTFHIRNSWGVGWGDQGYMHSAITDSRGRRCNAVADGVGNAQVLEIGVPLPPQVPVEFALDGQDAALVVVVQPRAPFSVTEAREALSQAVRSIK